MRLLLLGSILPDLIDKPLAILLPDSIFTRGRTISHTLVFLMVLAVAGAIVRRPRVHDSLLAVSLGTLAHLILDQMWLSPHIILWPALGWTFGGDPVSIARWLRLLSDAGVYMPEIAGAFVALAFVILLAQDRKVLSFIKTGHT